MTKFYNNQITSSKLFTNDILDTTGILFISFVAIILLVGVIFFPVVGLALYFTTERFIPHRLKLVFLLIIFSETMLWLTFSSTATSDIWRIAAQFHEGAAQAFVDMKIFRAFFISVLPSGTYNFHFYLIVIYVLTALSFSLALFNLEKLADATCSKFSFGRAITMLVLLLPFSYSAAPEYMLAVCLGFSAISLWANDKRLSSYVIFLVALLVHFSMAYLFVLHFCAKSFSDKKSVRFFMQGGTFCILIFATLAITDSTVLSGIANYVLSKSQSYLTGVWSTRHGIVENLNFYFILMKLLVLVIWLSSKYGRNFKSKTPYLYYLAWMALIGGLFFSSFRTLGYRLSDYMMLFGFVLVFVNWDKKFKSRKKNLWIAIIVLLHVFRPPNALYLYGLSNQEEFALVPVFSPIYYAITDDFMEPKTPIGALSWRGYRND